MAKVCKICNKKVCNSCGSSTIYVVCSQCRYNSTESVKKNTEALILSQEEVSPLEVDTQGNCSLSSVGFFYPEITDKYVQVTYSVPEGCIGTWSFSDTPHIKYQNNTTVVLSAKSTGKQFIIVRILSRTMNVWVTEKREVLIPEPR